MMSEMMKRITKIQNRILAKAIEAANIVVNPNIPAMIAITKKIILHASIFFR